MGQTPIGRTTARLLQFNIDERVTERQRLIALDIMCHPRLVRNKLTSPAQPFTWHTGHRCVPRWPTMIFSIVVQQREQGLPCWL